MNQEQSKNIIMAFMAYGTNILYIILISMMTFIMETGKNASIAFLIFLPLAAVSMIISTKVIKSINLEKKPIDEGVKRLAVAHLPTLIGISGVIIYLFVL